MYALIESFKIKMSHMILYLEFTVEELSVDRYANDVYADIKTNNMCLFTAILIFY